MNDLEHFFWYVYLNRPWDERQRPVLIFDNVLVINFNNFFDRNYALMGTDQLIYQIDKHVADKNLRFIFMFEDGANPILSGGLEIVKHIVAQQNLTAETALIFSRDDLVIPNVTLVKEDSISMWIRVLYPTIKDIPFYTGSFTKKFAAWFHRGTFYRLQIARLLYEKYKDDSFISYQEYGMLHDLAFIDYFKDDIEWANANTPIIYDQLFPMRVYDHNMIVGSGRKPYNDYFIEIVVETDCVSNTWITEKTVKNLYIGKPFLMMCGAGSLAHLHKLGFKTFSPWIDESYDQITNTYLRFEAIKKEIDRLAAMSIQELNDMHQEMLSILAYNRQHFSRLLT
jgi:hypothetical protein